MEQKQQLNQWDDSGIIEVRNGLVGPYLQMGLDTPDTCVCVCVCIYRNESIYDCDHRFTRGNAFFVCVCVCIGIYIYVYIKTRAPISDWWLQCPWRCIRWYKREKIWFSIPSRMGKDRPSSKAITFHCLPLYHEKFHHIPMKCPEKILSPMCCRNSHGPDLAKFL